MYTECMLNFQTEIGYARAWVRLALERKSLSEYLRVLVSDAGLLKGMYKRYGFLRYFHIPLHEISYFL